MPTRAQTAPAVPRLTYLRIKNYRALRDVEFRDLTPLTVLIGPNGSGKSTVLDALDFLAEAVRGNLVGAWEKRNRFQGMRTRGSEGPIQFELSAKLSHEISVNYLLEINEFENGPVYVSNEILEVISPNKKRVFELDKKEFDIDYVEVRVGKDDLNKQKFPPAIFNFYKNAVRGSGGKVSMLNQPYLHFQSTLGPPNKFRLDYEQPLVRLISSYRYVHLTDDHLKGYSDAGPRERLSPNGDNLPNVLYYLHTRHPAVLENIAKQLRKWVPGLADIVPEITSDERILLRFKDAQFEKTMPAQYMSGGTMRLTALLTLLNETEEAGLLGIEEPENELHPQLLYRLTEAFEKAAEKRQLFITTHSPLILDALSPEQVWVMYRGADGYAHATRTADMPNVPELAEDGSMLGYLWTSNTFTVGDPQAPVKPTPDAR